MKGEESSAADFDESAQREAQCVPGFEESSGNLVVLKWSWYLDSYLIGT
jgi:hypothetical protein